MASWWKVEFLLDESKMSSIFIYLITNKLDGKRYVGQTDNLKRRWLIHQRSPRYVRTNKSRKPSVLQNAMLKHGVENFAFEPLLRVDSVLEADGVETYLIAEFGTRVPAGYNVAKGGNRGGRGRWSEEDKELFGTKRRGSSNPMFGRKTSAHAKALLSDSTRRSWTPERKERHVTLMKERWTPEKRELQGALMKEHWAKKRSKQ